MTREKVGPRCFFGIGATSMTEQATSASGDEYLKVAEPSVEFESTLTMCERYMQSIRARYKGASYRTRLFRKGRPVTAVIVGGVRHLPLNAAEAIAFLREGFDRGVGVEVETE